MTLPYSAAPTRAVIHAARGAGIPFQHAVFQNFSSDGREWIQEGVPTAMVAFPCRYTHSPYETVRESDLTQTADLLRAFVTTPPA
jgi:putative aminopeptidase FrvX